MDGDLVKRFDEKPRMMEGWINGGFFVLEPGIFDYIPGDVDWAKAPLESIADAGQLAAFRHEGFWQCMDTLRDKIYLNSLWDRGDAPWKTWA
jgi:glucose-1-phosphate cytidylyltransferase